MVKIPAFASDGSRLRPYSIEAVERLLSLRKVAVRRNPRGAIIRMYFNPQDGANPLRPTAHMGQRYVHQSRVNGVKILDFEHNDLLSDRALRALFGDAYREEREVREQFVRAVFRAVPLSVMRSAPQAGKVVSIERGRPQRNSVVRTEMERRTA